MPDKVRHGTPLTNVDTAWLHMEDPTNLMMVTGIFLFDQPVSFDRLRDTFQVRMAERFPRLRHRVRQEGSSAWWVRDPTFDINAHVHRIALPAPGDEAVLRDVVSDLMSTPLDFSKPLWQCHLLEDYGEGCGVLLRFHHCIGDGLALVHVLLSATDRAPDAAWPRPKGFRPFEKDVKSRIVSLFDDARAVVRRTVKTTRRLTGTILEQGVDSLLHPTHLLDVAQTAAEGAGVLLKMIVRPADPVTVFKGSLGVQKRAAWSSPVPVATVKDVARKVRGTVNDVLLTAVCGALRRYLLLRGDRAVGVEINAMVPVNLRPPEKADDLGNQFGLIYLTLPVGTSDPAERLRTVKKRMDAIKHTPEPFVAFQLLNALGVAPVEVADLLVDMFGSKSTAVMTNVIGPRQTIYFGGQPIRTVMFWVPQSGRMGLGVSIFSYDGNVVVGVATDARLVPDPESIARAFGEEVQALVEWAAHFDAPAALPADLVAPALPAPPTAEPPTKAAAPDRPPLRRPGGAAPGRRAARTRAARR